MSEPTPRLAIAQLEVKAGLPESNVERMLRMIDDAKRRGVDLIAFPEMCVGGYMVGDRWVDDAFCEDLMGFNETLRIASGGIAVAWGNIFLDREPARRGLAGCHPNKDGRARRYNAMYVAQDGTWARRLVETPWLPAGAHVKTLLPNYRFFDDQRYFFSLLDIALDAGVPLATLEQPFAIRIQGQDVPIGFEICEDLWCNDYRLDGEAMNATRMLIDNGARYIVSGSSSPWTYGKNGARDRRVKFLKSDSGDRFVPFLYANIVGAQNNGKNVITFDGGSTVYDRNGDPIVLANKAYAEELIVVDDFEQPPLTRDDGSKVAQKYEAIIQGIRHLKDMRGDPELPRVVIGLSGGVDSAVAAALLVKAIGPEKVFAVNMPTRFNSNKTIGAARFVAEALGIRLIELPIGQLVELNQRLVNEADLDRTARTLSSLDEENIQAKIRGTSILSNLAAKNRAIFSNNGNKLEIALGYATLYGDWGGALAVIGDLTKAEVYEMARYLNEAIFAKEVIPELLIPDALFRFRPDQIEPSAELKENQVDPMKFGYHCALLDAMTDFQKKTVEDVLEWYLAGTLHQHLGIDATLIERWGLNEPRAFIADLEWFKTSLDKAVFKRVQAPPIIVTSKSAYGYDIRESILPHRGTDAQRLLKEQILMLDAYRPSADSARDVPPPA